MRVTHHLTMGTKRSDASQRKRLGTQMSTVSWKQLVRSGFVVLMVSASLCVWRERETKSRVAQAGQQERTTV